MPRPVRWVAGSLVGVVLVAGVTWLVASQTMRTPADVAAETEPVDPGPITVPVEEQVLESEVIVRGTVQYEEPIEVELRGQPAVEGDAVVTRVPRADDEVAEGDVLLEVSGRPVFALQGELPAYRDLREDAEGDDVEQLQRALARLGHYDAEVDGEFGPATEQAVEELYDQAGQDLPDPAAAAGAEAGGAPLAAESDDDPDPWLPAGEVFYVPELPQRIDEVTAELGDEVSGSLLTISSPVIVIESSVPAEDVELVHEGDEVVIDADGQELSGEIVVLADEPGTDGAGEDRHHAVIDPEGDAEELLDASLRITIPVESTDGQVLTVPLAAVSAGADGSSRVELYEGSTDDDGDEQHPTRLIEVEPGLTSDGMVEVVPVDDELSAGDLVVVGVDADDADLDDEPGEEPDEAEGDV